MEILWFFLEVGKVEGLLACLNLLEQWHRVVRRDEDHRFANVEGAERAVDRAVADCVRNFRGVQGRDVVDLVRIRDRQLHDVPFVGGARKRFEFHLRPNISTIKVVKNIAHRFVFLAFAGAALLVGLFAGASLLGVAPASAVTNAHGPLMVFGFVGGAIGLERAVAVKKTWAWAGPAFHVLAVLTLLAGVTRPVPAVCFALSFLVLGFIYLEVHRRQPTLAVLVQAAGVIGGVAASLLWAMTPSFATAMPLCVLYVVATIIGERMELARVTMAGTRAENLITALILALAAAGVIYILVPAVGYRLMGALLLAISLTTVRVDVAKNLVRAKGLPRYSAACMLAGYFWLALAGLAWLGMGQVSGFSYDASVHTVFLGFVMSMIFAHAPIILTSVIRKKLPYNPVLYGPVVLLHAGLMVRVGADIVAHTGVYQVGGMTNVVAVLLFVLSGFVLTIREARRAHR